MPAGSVSLTSVFVASALPAFVTVTVYVTVPPGISDPAASAVFVTLICGTAPPLVSASHGAGVLPGVHRPPGGGFAVATFVIVPGGLFAIVATIV